MTMIDTASMARTATRLPGPGYGFVGFGRRFGSGQVTP